jgi:DNA recombination protein RmuC
MNRLKEGKGNLVGRIEELRKLGAKTSKCIPLEIQEKAFNENGEIEKEGNR